MKKKILFLLFVPFLLTAPVAFARALETTGQTATQNQLKTERIQSLKDRAVREIDRRLTALDLLTKKIDGVRRLTSEEKTAYLADINNNITELNNLKTQISSETDVVKLKAEVQSIVKNYRIFALYIPKIHLLAAADVLTEITTDLSDLATKLSTKINDQEKAGKDVSELKADLAEMQARIADAKTQADKAVAAIIPLTASGYPENKGSLRAAFEALKTARADIVAAKQKSRSIIKSLKALAGKDECNPPKNAPANWEAPKGCLEQ